MPPVVALAYVVALLLAISFTPGPAPFVVAAAAGALHTYLIAD